MARRKPTPTGRLATFHNNGDITVPTAHGKIRLPRGSFSWVHGKTILRMRRAIRSEPKEDGTQFTLRRGRILMSNLTAGIFFVYKSLLTARRGLAHTVHNYGWDDMFSDEGELRRMIDVVAQSPIAMYLLCDYSRCTPKQIEAYRALVDKLMTNIGRPRNTYKVEMSWRAAKAHSLLDSLGRRNLPVSQRELLEVTELGGFRIEDIKVIVSFMDPRQRTIQAIIAKHWRLMHLCHAKMVGYLEVFEATGSLPEGIVHDINSLIGELRKCEDRPWFHPAERSIVDLKAARAVISRYNQTAEALRYFRRIKIAMELLQLVRLLADLLMMLSVEIRRKNPDRDMLVALQNRFTRFKGMIPIAFDDQGRLQATVDENFQGAPVSVRLYEFVEDGLDLLNAALACDESDKKQFRKKLKEAKECFKKGEIIF